MARWCALLTVLLCTSVRHSFAVRSGPGAGERHTRVLLQESGAEAAYAATPAFGVPEPVVQPVVQPAAIAPVPDAATAGADALAHPTVQEHHALTALSTLAAVAAAATPACASNSSYLQVMLACETTKLPQICSSVVEALLVQDINALNAAAGTTRKLLCYRGMIDTPTLPTVLASKTTTPQLLVTYTWATNSVRYPYVFTSAEQAAVQAAMTNKWLLKVMVWHSMNDPTVPSNVPGLNTQACMLWSAVINRYIHTESAAFTGAYPAVAAFPGAASGSSASYGSCPSATVAGLAKAKTYAEAAVSATAAGILPDQIVAFSYCRPGGGHMFYSTVPADFVYTKRGVAAWQTLVRFHPAALSAFTNDNVACV